MTSPRKKHNIDSLDATRAVIASLNRQMADYRKLTNPPYLDAFNQLANTMELVRLQHIQMSQAWMSLAFDSVAYLTDISNSSRHLYDMFSQTGVALDSLNLVHDSWFERIRDIITYPSQLDAVVKSTLCDCSIQLAVTESFLAAFDFNVLKSQFDFSLSTISAMERSIFDVTASYRTLAESIPNLSEIVQMPSFVLPGATYNLYTAGHALKALDTLDQPEDEEIEAEVSIVSGDYVDKLDCVALLDLVNPQLVRPYLGAKKALDGNNPDRKRHVLTSLRELWNHLVREIAPQEETLDWISENSVKSDLDCNNRPSRRGKIRYISRNINSAPLVDFVNHNMKVSTNLHELYNRVHQLEPGLADDQLRAIFYRTEAELSYLIRIWLTTARH